VDETYKMLGREHQRDLEREAAKRALASRLPGRAGLILHGLAWFRRTAMWRGGEAGTNVGDVGEPRPVKANSREHPAVSLEKT
jgi:hypothetical protein